MNQRYEEEQQGSWLEKKKKKDKSKGGSKNELYSIDKMANITI